MPAEPAGAYVSQVCSAADSAAAAALVAWQGWVESFLIEPPKLDHQHLPNYAFKLLSALNSIALLVQSGNLIDGAQLWDALKPETLECVNLLAQLLPISWMSGHVTVTLLSLTLPLT